tara:strand:- start:3013 stop:3720 length:708 start_codon:yes stop_codon:yes gene_type:complete
MIPGDTILRILVAALVALGGNLHVASVWINHKSEAQQLACEGHDPHSPFWVTVGAVPLFFCVFPLTLAKYSTRARGLWVVHLLIVLSAAAMGIPITAIALQGQYDSSRFTVLWLLPLVMVLTLGVGHGETLQAWCAFWIAALVFIALALPLTLWRAGAATAPASAMATLGTAMDIIAVAISTCGQRRCRAVVNCLCCCQVPSPSSVWGDEDEDASNWDVVGSESVWGDKDDDDPW